MAMTCAAWNAMLPLFQENCMLRRMAVVVCLLSCIALAQRAPEQFDVKAHYTKYEQYITMRDGKRLFTSIYVPKDTSKPYPFLMTRTPYSVAAVWPRRLQA